MLEQNRNRVNQNAQQPQSAELSRDGQPYFKNTKYAPKHITVDLGGKKPGEAGNVLSSRQVIDIVDEKGEKVRGFFTKDTYVQSIKNAVQSTLDKIQAPADDIHFEELRNKLTDNRNAQALFIDLAQNIGEDAFANTEPGVFDMAFNDHSDEILRYARQNLKLSFDPVRYYGNEASAQAYDGFRQLINNFYNAASKTMGDTEYRGMDTGSPINTRNNAMYAYAELLGISDIVARSTPMTIKNGKEEIHGSCMVGAKGYSRQELSKHTPGFANKPMKMTGQGLKKTSRLRLLDYMCANIDRHGNNMFYQTNVNRGVVEIIGVQGIDNDASFGKISSDPFNGSRRVYGKMSLLPDIAVIDEETAKAVQELDPEKMEDTLRLAGLSATEISYARERLTALQKKIADKQIAVFDDQGWENVANNDQFYQQVCVDLDQDNANIFQIVKETIDGYNRYRNQDYPFGQPENHGDIPVVQTVNIEDAAGLSSHIQSFTKIKNDLDKMGLIGDIPQSFLTMKEQVGDVLAKMKEFREKMDAAPGENDGQTYARENHRLTTAQRNELTTALNGLHTLSEQCVKDLETAGVAVELKEIAKNTRVFSEFAHDAIGEDVAEAERNKASKEFNDASGGDRRFVDPDRAAIAEARRLTYGETEHTFDSLKDRVFEMAGRSSQFYKTMLSELEQKGDFSGNLSVDTKIENCEALITAAQAYIDHKLPQTDDKNKLKAAEDKLTPNEKRRVQFARDLIEYASVNKTALQNSKMEKAFEKDDTDAIDAFLTKCGEFAGAFEQDARSAARNVRQNEETIVKGLKNIFYTADRYTPGHPMQQYCAEALKKFDGYAKLFFNLPNKSPEGKGLTYTFDVFGMDAPGSAFKAATEKVNEINSRARAITEKQTNADPKAAERKLTYKKTKHTFDGLMRRTAALDGSSTKYYKKMMSELSAKGDLSKIKDSAEKIKSCQELIEAANGYLQHKMPDLKTADGLNEKEKERVRFAKDLLEYASVNKNNLENKQKDKEFRAADMREMTEFANKYEALADAYKKAAPGAQKNQAAQNILAEKERFAEGLNNVFQSFDRYPAAHDIQLSCMLALKKINGFEDAFQKLTNAGNRDKVSIYEALGMQKPASEISEKVNDIISRGENAQQLKKESQQKERDLTKTVAADVNNYGGMEEIDPFTKTN